VNQIEYKKVYRYHLEPDGWPIYPPYHRIDDPVLFGLIREDIIAKKVYGIYLEFNYPELCFYTEELMFDYSVSQYDTIELCQAIYGEIPILNTFYHSYFGYWRRVSEMGSYYDGNCFIEGIGSTYGLFEMMGFTSEKSKQASDVLICYTSGNISTCDVVTTIEKHDNKSDTQFTIFPNPATSFISIQINEGIAMEEAIIYNHLGQKALVAVPVNNTVDVSGLQKGMYIIEITTNERKYRKKLVID
jgi:hypothetical protein